jgi:hypothetical protein
MVSSTRKKPKQEEPAELFQIARAHKESNMEQSGTENS